MNVYILLILLLSLLSFITLIKTNRQIDNFYLFLVIILVFLILVLRGNNVGTDTISYIKYFQIIDSLDWKEVLNSIWKHKFYSTEIGYTILQKVVGIFFDNPQWIIVTSGAIYIYGIYRLIKEYCEDKVMAIFTFLAIGSYLLSFNLMRQAIAVGIGCLSWIFQQKGENKKALLAIVLACTFHTSAIVLFIFFLVKKIPANKKNFGIIGFSSIIFGIFGTQLVDYVIQFFPVYSKRYGFGRWEIDDANGILIVWGIIVAISILILFTTNWDNIEFHFQFEIITYAMIYFGINILGQSYDGFGRLGLFFQPFLIVLIDRGKKRFDSFTQNIYFICVVISMSLLFLRSSSTSQYLYNFFWQ